MPGVDIEEDQYYYAALRSRMRWALGTTFSVPYGKSSVVGEIVHSFASEIYAKMKERLA